MIYLITIGLLLLLMIGWIVVEHAANQFAHKHPEFGPPRKLGCGGCGNKCAGHCENDEH